MNVSEEIRTAKYFSLGLTLVTLVVYTSGVSDPVNAPKLLILGVTAACASAFLLLPKARYVWANSRLLVIIGVFFTLASILSATKSNSPLSQNIYGVSGRNTGLLCHFALVLILLSVASLGSVKSLKVLFYGFLFSGITNVIYCLWVLTFGDFISWTNPYKSLLGTLGNPNFISAFLALFGVAMFAFMLCGKFALWKWALTTLLLLVVFFEILHTSSTQGLVVLVLGIYLVLLVICVLVVKRKWISVAYLFAGAVSSILGILGLLNKGPLSSVLFQETLQFRKEYWIAGLNMGQKFPLNGVGMDSYGDWYRELRTLNATVRPGLDVVTNVAHNVYIDAFASGGFPLLAAYLALSGYALVSTLKVIRRKQANDPFFIAIGVTWICYQVQSIISINQIGLAVWGWAFSGMLISYEVLTRDIKMTDKPSSRNSWKLIMLRPLSFMVAATIGFLVYAPPLLADKKWTSAYSQRNADLLYESMNPSYFNPENSFKYVQAVQLFENSGFFEKSHTLVLDAISYNPRSFDSWQMLYLIKNSTAAEREEALIMMIKLDPKNNRLKEPNR